MNKSLDAYYPLKVEVESYEFLRCKKFMSTSVNNRIYDKRVLLGCI